MNGESDYVQFSSDTTAAKQACINSIPEVSREKYKKSYKSFIAWQKEKNIPSKSENVLLAYFDELSQKFKSSTLWAQYSMLRTMMNIEDNVDIGNYSKVRAFLKRNSSGYRPKKSKIFSTDEIDNFIKNAPDDFYLLDKVLLIMGIMGASRRDELYKMKTTDCRDLGSAAVLVRIPNRKTNVSRKFTITGLFYDVYKKYRDLRPAEVGHNYFFLNYQKTKCSVQRVGINKIGYTGKRIAEYLKLPNPELYTGHCFRRSSGTIPPGRGLNSLKRHGCWNLQTLEEESDDEESLNEKILQGDKYEKLSHTCESPRTATPSSTESEAESESETFELTLTHRTQIISDISISDARARRFGCVLSTSYSERENTMDTEKFIETVKMNPLLYDARHKDYKNMAKKAEVWERIARELNEKSDVLRIKWKGLKDGYTKYKKNGKTLMGGSKSYINWCWGPHLQFLDDFQKRRSISSNSGVHDVDSSSLPPLVPLKSTTAESETSLQSFLPTFSRYVPTKTDEDAGERTREDDSIEHLFNSYAETFRTFTLKTRATVKVRMAKLFADAELMEHDMGPIQSPICPITSVDNVFSASEAENSNGIKTEVLPIDMTIPQYTPSTDSAQIPDSGSSVLTRSATKAFQHPERVELQTNQHEDDEATQSDHSENSRTSTPTKQGGKMENFKKNQKRPVDSSAINDVIRKLRKISDDSNQYSNEFDVFCDSLAIQLKKMPVGRALICQEKLQSVMTQERLFQLSESQSNSYDYDRSQTAGSSNPYQFVKSSPPADPEDNAEYYSET